MMEASTSPWPFSSGESIIHAPLRSQIQSLDNVLYVGFNQNYNIFLCGTESGFKVYDSHTLKEKNSHNNLDQEIVIVEVLGNTSFFALVGRSKNSQSLPKSVKLYSNVDNRCIGELCLPSIIRAIKLLPNYVIVVSEYKVYVYEFSLKLVYEFETLSNINGLIATAYPSPTDHSASTIACMGQLTGQVMLKKLNKKGSYHIQAYREPLACLALNSTGSLLATASTSGTVINIFRTSDGTKLQELHRGRDPAQIYSMAFSVNSRWLVLSSSKETIHVFNIKTDEPNATKQIASESRSHLSKKKVMLASTAATVRSSLSYVKGMMPKLLTLEGSFCQIHIPNKSRTVVGFGYELNTILVLSTNGSLFKCVFDPINGGPCQILQDFCFP